MAGNPYKVDTSPYSYDGPKYASYALNSTAKLLSGATDEDLRVVTQKCAQDEKVIAVWRIPKEKQSTAACSMMPLALFYLPCFCGDILSIDATATFSSARTLEIKYVPLTARIGVYPVSCTVVSTEGCLPAHLPRR